MRKFSEESLKEEHGQRLDRVMEYIRNHYADKLSLEKLAAVACFSKFHFHRVFKTLNGETVNNCIRRIRLDESIRKLRQDVDLSISEIAYSCGFSTSQNFSRAFKAHFGVTPASVRKEGNGQFEVEIQEREDATPLRVEVKDLPACRVAYIRCIGPHQSEYHTQALYRLFRWAVEKTLRKPPPFAIALSWGDTRVIPPDEHILDLCLIVPEGIEGEGDFQIQWLPEGKFAVFHGEIPASEMQVVEWRIIDEWLPSSGYQLDLKPTLFKMYNNPYANPRKLVIVDICLAVKPEGRR